MSLRDKEVIVIDEDGQEMKIKQFCQQILEDDLALISGTNYDNENKVYHRYLDCYEDWAEPLKSEFKRWKVKNKKELKEYRECARCQERKYREKHPDARITGYDFHYYFENYL